MRWRRYVAWGLGIVLAVGLGGAVAFVHRAEVRLGEIPALVQDRLAAHGSSFVPLHDVPTYLIEATVAVEDRSFWTNPGISPEGIARAAVVDIVHRRFVEGGSTITQELVRDMLLSLRKTLSRKITGTLYSLLCADRYSKDAVMSYYLNEVNYGNGAFGIAAAAKTYFGLPPSSLGLSQCALLAGLPQNPAGLDPFVHIHAARARELVVLDAMVDTNVISTRQAKAAEAAPLGLLPHG